MQGWLRLPQAKKILDELTDQKILTAKDYGKAWVYLINQDFFPETTNDDLAVLDEQIKIWKEELDQLNWELNELKD